MLKFSEFVNFLGKYPILKEFEWFKWFEWFEWFGPSPIEPLNSGAHGADPRRCAPRRRRRRGDDAAPRGGAPPRAPHARRQGGGLSVAITCNFDLLTCITCKCCYICNFFYI